MLRYVVTDLEDKFLYEFQEDRHDEDPYDVGDELEVQPAKFGVRIVTSRAKVKSKTYN